MNREQQAEYDREKYLRNGYIATPKHIKRTVEWQRRNPQKLAAIVKVYRAVKANKIKRPNCCSLCGCTNRKISAHHENYSKPYEVVWLCQSCHMLRHYASDEIRAEDLKIERVIDDEPKSGPR